MLLFMVVLGALVGLGEPGEANAQTKDEGSPPRPSEARTPSKHSFSLSYLGYNFTHPGGSLGYSYRLLTTKSDLHALVVGAELGGYFWARHSAGAFVTPRIGWRGRHPVGLQGEIDGHLGYLHTFLPSAVYQVKDGRVEETFASFPFLWTGVTAGVGWYFKDVFGKVDLAPFSRVGAFFQYPMFDQTLLRFTVQAGVEVRL